MTQNNPTSISGENLKAEPMVQANLQQRSPENEISFNDIEEVKTLTQLGGRHRVNRSVSSEDRIFHIMGNPESSTTSLNSVKSPKIYLSTALSEESNEEMSEVIVIAADVHRSSSPPVQTQPSSDVADDVRVRDTLASPVEDFSTISLTSENDQPSTSEDSVSEEVIAKKTEISLQTDNSSAPTSDDQPTSTGPSRLDHLKILKYHDALMNKKKSKK